MSLNLCFTTLVGNRHISFPFQTPTELTNKILKLGTKQLQLNALREYLYKGCEGKADDTEYIEDVLKECEDLLNDTSIRLTYI